jgi:hypothetical protein
MRWVLRLVETGADAPSRSADLMEICRPEGLGEIAGLGLTLAEAKRLLTSVQRAIVASQADHHGRLRPDCRSCSARCHVKDWRPHQVATLFGEMMARLPRFLCAACNRTETGLDWPLHVNDLHLPLPPVSVEAGWRGVWAPLRRVNSYPAAISLVARTGAGARSSARSCRPSSPPPAPARRQKVPRRSVCPDPGSSALSIARRGSGWRCARHPRSATAGCQSSKAFLQAVAERPSIWSQAW